MVDKATQTMFSNEDSDQNPKPNQTPSNTPDPESSLAVLVGPGRKYANVEELAKAYVNLDSFTEKLKDENADFREKLAGAKTIDDVLHRLQPAQASTPDKGADQASSLTADAVAKIVRDTVTGMETQRTRQQNLAAADKAMREQFGEKAEEVFLAQANTPELRAALTSLAAVSPEKFVQMFSQGSATKSTQTDTGGSVNAAALGEINQSGRVNDPGTKEFYTAIRQKDPKKFYSAAVQLAMNRAATADPDKYFGRKR